MRPVFLSSRGVLDLTPELVGQLPTMSAVSKVEEKYGVIAAITGSRGSTMRLSLELILTNNRNR